MLHKQRFRLEQGSFSRDARLSRRSLSKPTPQPKVNRHNLVTRLHQSSRSLKDALSKSKSQSQERVRPRRKGMDGEESQVISRLNARVAVLQRQSRDKDNQIKTLCSMLDSQLSSFKEDQARLNKEVSRLRKSYDQKKQECQQLRSQIENSSRSEHEDTVKRLKEQVFILKQQLRRKEFKGRVAECNKQNLSPNQFRHTPHPNQMSLERIQEESDYSSEKQQNLNELQIRRSYSPEKPNHLRVREGDRVSVLNWSGSCVVVMRGDEIGLVPRTVLQ